MSAVSRTCRDCSRISAAHYPKCMYCGGTLVEASESDSSGLDPEGESLSQFVEGAEFGLDLDPARLVDVFANPDSPQPLVEETEDISFSPSFLLSGKGLFGARQDPHRLLLLPHQKHQDEGHWLCHRIAAVLGIDLYTAKARLRSPVPLCLASGEDKGVLEAKMERLREVGILAVLLSKGDLSCSEEFTTVVALREEPAGVGPLGVAPILQAETEDGRVLSLRRDEFLWLSFASIDGSGLTGVGAREASPARSGGKSARKVPRDLASERGTAYHCLALLRRGNPDPLFLRSDRFDFSCFGESRSLAAAVNLRQMSAWLAPDLLSDLPLDEDFRRMPPSPSRRRGAEGGKDRKWQLQMQALDFAEYVLIRHHFWEAV